MPTTSGELSGSSERIQHALWAGLIALAMSLLTLIEPLDQFAWTIQSRLASFEASGEIVYVGSTEDLSDADFPQRRVRLARTIEALQEAGAERVYVDVLFDKASDPAADRALNQALKNFEGRSFLTRNMATGLNGEDRLESSVPAVRAGVQEVGTKRRINYLGYTWDMPYVVTDGDEQLPSMPASIADTGGSIGAQFPISYGFELSSIPTFRLADVAQAARTSSDRSDPLGRLVGKTVVIGNTDHAASNASNIPGHPIVPTSMVSIYAAETLLADHTEIIGSLPVLLTALGILCLLGMSHIRAVRYGGYTLICVGLPLAVFLAAQSGIKINVSAAVVLLMAYALFRARAKWKRSFRLIDAGTGLPTFAALEGDREAAETLPAIIVAKIHRFEEVRESLPAELHSEYLTRIADRLRAAKKDATIYVGPGHLIAWTFREKDPALIKEHLEGLRALFSSPLLVGENLVDVGITFGVDVTPSPDVTRRVATAVAAAERTTETYEPVEIAELASDEDMIWNISLQARIDSALSSGQIYLIYQPKILVQTGELVGVEALVRWRDPAKGLIPPDHFIRQCENAGRMHHLTHHVLLEACKAGNTLEGSGLKLSVAVNISATLVHERAIVNMVREVLEETGFDPRRLTLEITETFRISDFDRASEILAELAALGPKLSMDDFGVGAASLEALLRLPFSELKIDRLFTASIRTDAKAEVIVKHILQLGKELRITVVAEGVEDEATLRVLRQTDCLLAQGFAISRPISLEEVVRFERLNQSEGLTNMV